MTEEKANIITIKKSTILFIAALIILVIIGYFLITSSSGGKGEMIASDSPVLGNSNATIAVVEFSDYQCPYCGAAEGTNEELIAQFKQRDPTWEAPIPKVIDEYVKTGKIKLIFRNFPISAHQYAKKATLAAKCAYEQNKFWEYHNTLFENQEALTDLDLKKYAVDLGLNANQFSQCLESNKYEESINKDIKDGTALGVEGTPTFFIGNEEKGYEKIVGAEPFSAFKSIIDSKLA
jgi:protein-disulfide isomerase